MRLVLFWCVAGHLFDGFKLRRGEAMLLSFQTMGMMVQNDNYCVVKLVELRRETA